MLERFWWGLAIFNAHPRIWPLFGPVHNGNATHQQRISSHGNATYQRKYDLYYMFRLYIIDIDHILPASILLCPSKPMACMADSPIFSFIWLKIEKGYQGEAGQTMNQNHSAQRYMWKTPRTGETNPTYREKWFQVVIQVFPILLGDWKNSLLVVVLSYSPCSHLSGFLVVVTSWSYSPNFFHFFYCFMFFFFAWIRCERKKK